METYRIFFFYFGSQTSSNHRKLRLYLKILVEFVLRSCAQCSGRVVVIRQWTLTMRHTHYIVYEVVMTDALHLYAMTHFNSLQYNGHIRRHNVYFMQTWMCCCYKNMAKLGKALRSLICHILQTKLPHILCVYRLLDLTTVHNAVRIDYSRNIVNKIYGKSPK